MARTTKRMAVAAQELSPSSLTPPANLEAEQAVLGAILLRPQVLDQVADLVGARDF